MGPKPRTPTRRLEIARPAGKRDATAAAEAVTALYQDNALGLIRLAHVMLGDHVAAEDIVQDAFCALYRRWAHLSDQDKALAYLRSCVLNSCRSALRRKRPHMEPPAATDRAPSDERTGEAAVLIDEERKAVMAALRRLPYRQREVLVLRFYLTMTDAQIAAQMGIGQSTVRSSAHRALAALGQILGESR